MYSFYCYHTINYNITYIQFIRYTWLEADSICVLFQVFLKKETSTQLFAKKGE